MLKSTKILLTLTLFTACCTLIAGCGGNEQPPATDASPAAVDGSPPPVIETPADAFLSPEADAAPSPADEGTAEPAPADDGATPAEDTPPTVPAVEDPPAAPAGGDPPVKAEEPAEDLEGVVNALESWFKRQASVFASIKDKASADQAAKDLTELHKEFKTLDTRIGALKSTAEQRAAVKPQVRKIIEENQASVQKLFEGFIKLDPQVMGALQGPMSTMAPMILQSNFVELGRNAEFVFAPANPDSGLTIKTFDASGSASFPQQLEGKVNTSNGLSISPDGRYLAGYSDENKFNGKTRTYLVWDLKSGKKAYELTTVSPSGYVQNDLPISIKNHLFIVAANKLHVVDLAAGVEAMTITIPEALNCYSQKASPDGTHLALTGQIGFAPVTYLLDLEARAMAWSKKIRLGGVSVEAFSPDGKQMLRNISRKTAEDEQTEHLQLTDAANGESIWEKPIDDKFIAARFSTDGTPLLLTEGSALKLNPADGADGDALQIQPTRSMAFSSDGSFIAGARGPSFRPVRDIYAANAAGQELFQVESAFAYKLLIDNGKTLVGANRDGELMVYKIASAIESGDRPPTLLHTLKGHTEGLSDVAYSPDGKYAATTGRDKTIRFWDTANGKLLHTADLGESTPFNIAFSANSKLLISNVSSKPLTLYDVETGKEKMKLDKMAGNNIRSASTVLVARKAGITANNSIVNSQSTSWAVWGPGAKQRLIKSQDIFRIAEISTDAKLLAVYDGQKYKTIIRNFATGKLIQSIDMDTGPSAARRAFSFSSDGSMLAIAEGRFALVYSVATGKQLHSMEINKLGVPVSSLQFAPDSSLLAVALQKVQLWDAKTGQKVVNIDADQTSIADIEFSGDGKRLISAGASGDAKIWDVESVVGRYPLK